MLDTFLRQLLLLIQPFGFVWLCLLVLTLRLCWIRLWRFAVATGALVVLMFIVGATDFPGALLRSLEREFAGVQVEQLPEVDAVVLLGGGGQPSRFEASSLHLTRAGDRVLMAVHLMRLGKAPVLVIGGGAGKLDGTLRNEADLVRNWISDWNLLKTPRQTTPEILSLGHCTDTHHEALKVRALADSRGWRRVLLVTSASHMRRALATFRTAGVAAEPVACNFITTVSTSAAEARLTVPRYEGLEKIAIVLHEWVGWVEYRRRGWIKSVTAIEG
ncbi:MAG: YdcF family protein [Verrucomicrobiaceae bacterium]|nr:MAG: YdcF family protein [Verrucomicrobiaceae bacterium]